jgi:co-chaperonin GroES (HSP10)
MLPDPVGYRILVRPHVPSSKTEGGVYLSDKTQETMEVTTVVGLVIKMGSLCYQDTDKFPSGPWCKEGDFILARPNSGTRVKIHGKEFRLINDDSVEAVVQDPRGISRA